MAEYEREKRHRGPDMAVTRFMLPFVSAPYVAMSRSSPQTQLSAERTSLNIDSNSSHLLMILGRAPESFESDEL